MRSRLLVRIDGAGASHELIDHLLSLSSRRRTVLLTCGWAITAADEQTIRLLPATGWQAAVDQDGAAQAQDRSVTVYQYRRVPEDKIDEFLRRETTYWSKVAEKAAKDKKMTFWAVLQKVGGYDLPNNSNFLFINTFPDVDKAWEVWSTDIESIAGAKMPEMETNSMSVTTSQFFLKEQEFVQAKNANPEKDFNFVVFNYQNTDYQDSMINLEKKYWKPFIEKTMNAGQTKQMAWGNSIVLAPMGDNIKFTTVSYDLYKTLQDALLPDWDPKVVFPTKGLQMIGKIAQNRRGISVYRIVKVVTTPM